MKIAQTCQGDTLANLDQEGPNVKKTAKICYADGKTRFTQNQGTGAWTTSTYLPLKSNGSFTMQTFLTVKNC